MKSFIKRTARKLYYCVFRADIIVFTMILAFVSLMTVQVYELYIKTAPSKSTTFRKYSSQEVNDFLLHELILHESFEIVRTDDSRATKRKKIAALPDNPDVQELVTKLSPGMQSFYAYQFQEMRTQPDELLSAVLSD